MYVHTLPPQIPVVNSSLLRVGPVESFRDLEFSRDRIYRKSRTWVNRLRAPASIDFAVVRLPPRTRNSL